MKFGSSFLLVFATVLSTYFAFGQGEDQNCNDSEIQVAAARCAYTRDETCRPLLPAATESPRTRGVAGTQLPGRTPGVSRRYLPPKYPYWHREVSGSHVAIGATIGLALGALIGSRGGAKAAFGFGLLGSGFGAAFGAGMPPMPPRRYYVHPDDDGEETSRTKSQPPRLTVARSRESDKAMYAVPQAK